jgi:CO dehydrogenase maturation factor
VSIRVAVAGKGGAGKSVLAGTLARLLAQEGRRVLALDSDLLPGMEFTLGVRPPDPPPLIDAAVRKEGGGWRMQPGVGAVRAVQRYATHAPDGVRLLQCGKVPVDGVRAIMPAVQAFYMTIHRLKEARALAAWDLVGDLPAGPRQVGYGWSPYADRILLVVEPSAMSMLAGLRTARVASHLPDVVITPVASKIRSPEELRRIEGFLNVGMAGAIPWDPAVAEAERRGVALVDHAPDSRAVNAVRDLLGWLLEQEARQIAYTGAPLREAGSSTNSP